MLITLALIAATAPVVYREPARGVEVRVRGAFATVVYADPACGLRSARRVPVRRGRFRRRTDIGCTNGSPLLLTGRITRRRVTGRVGDLAFVARRNAPRTTRAQRCALRGKTIARTPLVRAFTEGDRTLACRLGDGFSFELAETFWDDQHYYSSGISARALQAIGSRIAYVRSPFDSARSKFGQDPGFEDDVIVHDLVSGARSKVHPELYSTQGLAMRDDGAVAWAGYAQSYGGEVAVQTVRDGQTVTLDRGRIDPASLSVADGQFVWTKRP